MRNIDKIPEISIIVPVYNAEKYLEKCLDSLIGQTFENIEILCVNDGSTDNSPAILHRYAKMDPRVHVFDRPNSGPASARNAGLDHARGKYLMFCDADDEYTPSMCQEMYQAITEQNVDLVMCNTFCYNKEGKEVFNGYMFPFSRGKFAVGEKILCKINVYLWNKIFRKSLLDKYSLRFPQEYKSDDNYFVFAFSMASKSVYFVDRKLYRHYDRENSIMDLYRNDGLIYKDIQDHLDIMDFLYDFLCRWDLWKKNENSFKKIFFNELYYAWFNTPDIWAERLLKRCAEILNKIQAFPWGESLETDAIITQISHGNFYQSARALDALWRRRRQNRRRYARQEDLKPAFASNRTAYVFNCDNRFVKYLSVALVSLLEHASKRQMYDVIVLHEDISAENQDILKSIVKERKNFSLRFYSMQDYRKKYILGAWMTRNHISTAAYYRLFIPRVLCHFEKIVYLDADIIINTDLAELLQIPLKNYALAAVKDHYVSQVSAHNDFVFPGFYKYATETLHMPQCRSYFNSGVLLCNVKKMEGEEIFSRLMETAAKNTRYFHDQNVLNSVFYGQVLLLDGGWNVQINSGFGLTDALNIPPLEQCKIIHFCSNQKPWNTSQAAHPFYKLWWKYARQSPFYEEILRDWIKKSISQPQAPAPSCAWKIYGKYYRCKLLSWVTWGKKRKHYQRKRDALHEEVRRLRNQRK